MNDIEMLREQFENGFFLASGKVDYTRPPGLQNPFYLDDKHHLNFGYGYDYPSHGASELRSFLPQEILELADRVQRERKGVKGLNQALELLSGKDLDWRPIARQLAENVGAGIRDKLATLLLNGKDATGGRGAAHALGMCLELSALPHSVQDALIDRAYNAGPNDFSKIGMSLLKDVARNDLASAAHELAGNKVTKEYNYNLGAERRAMMEAMVLLGFDVELDRINDIAKLSGNVPADAINSFLVRRSSSEDGRHWLLSQNVGGSLLQAIGEYNQAYQGNAPPIDQAASAGSAGSSPPTNGNPSSSTLRLDRAAQDRAVHPTVKRSAAPIQRREAEAAEQVPQTGERDATESGTSTGYLARPQGISPGAAVRPAGNVGHPAAAHDAGRTEGKRGWHSPRSGTARPQATRALIQGRSETRGSAKPDPASFAALGGPSYLAVAMATGLGQSGRMVQAAAARLPDWMTSGTAAETGPGAVMVTEGSRAPSWAVPTWVQPGADDGMTKESPARPVQMQTAPAAPGAASVTAGGAWRSFGQDRGEATASLPGMRAAWADSAPGMGHVSQSEGAAPAGFGVMEDVRRQVLDEMTRLASRPPAGVTGFDAGQMPAWLSGWTGGV